jgi:signal transduction histidine kinase
VPSRRKHSRSKDNFSKKDLARTAIPKLTPSGFKLCVSHVAEKLNLGYFRYLMRKLTPKSVLFLLGFLLVYFYCGKFGILIQQQTGFAPLIWIPTGLGFSALMIFGLDLWPVIAIGTFLTAYFTHGDSFLYSFIMCGEAALEAVIPVILLRRFFPKQITFTKVNEVLGFFFLVILIANGIGSTLEIGGLYISGLVSVEDLFPTWRSWWLGHGLANLFIAPLLLNFAYDTRFRIRTILSRPLESIALGFAIVIVSIFVLTLLSEHNHSLLIRPYFLFSLLLWTALRFELFGSLFANTVIITTSIIGTLQGYNPFPTYPPSEQIALFQFLIGALSLTGLASAATVREKTEAVEARNEFLGIASHELKTPITSLKINLQMLERKISQKKDQTPEEATYATSLKKVDRQINRLVAIVDQLLDVSRVERKKLGLHREDVELDGLIRNLLERLSGTIATAKCTIETRLEPNIHGNWDPFRMEQVIENLISNALKYAPGKPIRVATSSANGVVEISVQDGGPGIEETKRPYIFDRFARANENPHVQGLGLGLFITRQIVKAHSGNIAVVSEVGNGARFVVSLPLMAPSA